MKLIRAVAISLMTVLALALWHEHTAQAAPAPPYLSTVSAPVAGPIQILFHGDEGPFIVQVRDSLDASSPWTDLPGALITKLQPGVYLAFVPTSKSQADLGFYRVVSESGSGQVLEGWTILTQVSAPANGKSFVKGEAPVVTVTILDTMAQGITRDLLSTLNLYMYGPEEPEDTVTAAKLLNASVNRTNSVHHYINLKNNSAVQVNGNVLTYKLQPISDELPGSYSVGVYAVLASDGTQQLMKFSSVQIGTDAIEKPVVTKTQCASCHEGSASGKIYMHHIDPGRSPTGSWALDYTPVTSCKMCHNNDGYAAYTDATGAKVPDPIVRRVHGVHRGADLKLPFNNDPAKGDFKSYIDLEFPADLRNCATCHVDDRWKTEPSRLACGSCHDNTWFGPKADLPTGWVAHQGGPQPSDLNCTVCHVSDPSPNALFPSIAENHAVPAPKMDKVDISLTPPANGKFYTAGDTPVVTVVIRDDKGNPIDHTQVTDANFSTASLFVYGPRAETVPVLTSAAKYVNDKLRASVSSSIAGPWAINGKIFKLAINGSAPQEITIKGAGAQVTAAEVVASLNPVITNLNGGAKATVSGTAVNIKTLIQGANARIEIYNGDVTTAMGWKRAPNTTLEPDVTVAAAFTPANDLRALSDPLDFADPQVTRTAANITYQLSDVAGLPAGTYAIYSYDIAKSNKVAGVAAPVAIGFMNFQVGSTNIEPKIATDCARCHQDTIFHLASGPIHPEPFDTDYCKACHDYGHASTGDMFKNQGGTSLNGWSGYGAMPISRRVHGVHFGAYLDHPEEIYANATKDTFGHIIFPQDVRNCTTCHSQSDTWKQKPSRITCLACHDGDDAKAHGTINTFIGDPSDPYGPKSIESCTVCHGDGAAFSPDKVHNISKPYVPPYPRGE